MCAVLRSNGPQETRMLFRMAFLTHVFFFWYFEFRFNLRHTHRKRSRGDALPAVNGGLMCPRGGVLLGLVHNTQ